MKRPLRSRFMGHDYKILWEPAGSVTVESGESGEDSVRCHGLTTEDEQTIQIEDDLSPTMERAVLIHEMLHQMFNSSGFDLDGAQEEAIVSYLGEALGAHISSNQSLWRYLIRRIKDTPNA